MIKDLLEELKNECSQIIEGFRKEIAKFRTGRASVAVLDGIQVEYFGVPTPLNQLATLGVPEANLIVVQPWDVKLVPDVEKAIRNANIGINPVSDGKVIKLFVPPLDEQRRLEIIKTLKKYAEERKTSVRNVRRDYRDTGRQMKDDKEISEDEETRFYDEIQKQVDEAIAKIEEIQRTREKHIMED